MGRHRQPGVRRGARSTTYRPVPTSSFTYASTCCRCMPPTALAAGAYHHLMATHPHLMRPEYAWLYCRADEQHNVGGEHALALYAITFADPAAARAFFAERQWDFDGIEFAYLRRAAQLAPGRFPEPLGPDYPPRGERLLLAAATIGSRPARRKPPARRSTSSSSYRRRTPAPPTGWPRCTIAPAISKKRALCWRSGTRISPTIRCRWYGRRCCCTSRARTRRAGPACRWRWSAAPAGAAPMSRSSAPVCCCKATPIRNRPTPRR